jgi:peptidylprolyl isomerase
MDDDVDRQNTIDLLQVTLKSKEDEIDRLNQIINSLQSKSIETTTTTEPPPIQTLEESFVTKDIIYNGDSKYGNPCDGFVVRVHYKIFLVNNDKSEENQILVEDSRERREGKAFEFILGQGDIISGWEVAIKQMTKGEVSMVKIPSDAAYGPTGLSPVVPADTDLMCRIELIDFWKHEPPFRPWII